MYAIFIKGQHVVTASYIVCWKIVMDRLPSGLIHNGHVEIRNIQPLQA